MDDGHSNPQTQPMIEVLVFLPGFQKGRDIKAS
jgi:hypothetical protein